ncbi:MAG TPA: SDR family NAD(P)-dependent oxidoreductase [Nakamurella sp.]|nr:SDR family NAD(P)-dependent oxidoreductase [Nakamurella sp.]
MNTAAGSELRGHVVIVTGASSGIGRATALSLAARGATVLLAARRTEELDAVQAQIARRGGAARTVPTDVTRPEDLERLVATALAVNGRIDGLVNIAGIGHAHSIMTEDAMTEDALLEQMIAINLLAPIRLMRAVIPIMRERGRGAIVNIGSLAGEIGVQGPYSATKFGLRGITDSVRRELAGTGIGVTLIEPGYIATPLTANRPGAMPGPDIVARAVRAALVRPRRRVIVPGKYRLAVFVARTLPGIMDRRFAGRPGGRTRMDAGSRPASDGPDPLRLSTADKERHHGEHLHLRFRGELRLRRTDPRLRRRAALGHRHRPIRRCPDHRRGGLDHPLQPAGQLHQRSG